MMWSRDEARTLMNKFGKERRPFFFMIDFKQQKNIVLPLEEVDPEMIQFEMDSYSVNEPASLASGEELPISKDIYSKQLYAAQFRKVVSEIKKGNSFLVNLTCETPVYLKGDLKQIFQQAEAKYKLWYKDQLVVFSPETFIRIEKGVISSFPMKGTIDASLPNAAELILNNPKEKAEHCTIVDLIRNDLSMVAENVKVVRFRYIDTLKTDSGKLLQVSSEISGDLPENYHTAIGDILFKLLPAGSVTGAPKEKTMEIILSTETYERGFYTGVFGVFDGQDLDSAVMIRFIEKTDHGFVYKSGGGITAFSSMNDEYDEMLKKIYVPFNRKH
ncbi:MAG: aminodeoxychorismate synthase component I [Bacteroidales bacterium]|nr:aminodeoxychorismate synthase component I [Bacteroidales bacterium]